MRILRKPAVLVLLIIISFLVFYLGSAPPSPVYYLKIGRESLQSFFVFGAEDRTNWLLTLSEKRMAEAEKLQSRNISFLARIQLNQAERYQAEAEELLIGLKDKVNRTYLQDKLNSNQEKARSLENIIQ